MSPKPFLYVFAILLLAGCSKNKTVINFGCNLSGNLTSATTISGNALTSFNAINSQPEPAFELVMNGPSGSSVNLLWYNLDSVNAEKNITQTYHIPRNTVGILAPYTVVAVYGPPNNANTGVVYSSNGGSGGTVTITKNTGPGGVISGTFSCTVVNSYAPFDSIQITGGTFTDVPVASD